MTNAKLLKFQQRHLEDFCVAMPCQGIPLKNLIQVLTQLKEKTKRHLAITVGIVATIVSIFIEISSFSKRNPAKVQQGFADELFARLR